MTSNKTNWFLLSILAVIAALVYLPLANKMGLYNDDWYLIYDAHSQGSQFFHTIYSIDRPARAYVMQAAYGLFGDNVLYYHISTYVYRTLAAWALFWALCLIFPRHDRANFVISLLFLIYPGFLSQINPIDYQAQILSLLLAMASISFTVKSLKSSGRSPKFMWLCLAILAGVIYPALVDYFLGLEVLRLCFVVLVVLQEQDLHPGNMIKRVANAWLPFLSAPALFLAWRIFFFENQRGATDIGGQLGRLFDSPLTGLWWLVYWMQDTFRVLFLAWVVPLNTIAFQLRLRDFSWGVMIGVVIALLALIGYGLRRSTSSKEIETELEQIWHGNIMIVGVVASVFALLPVIITNRHADLADYSRYTLASSAGAAMVVGVLLESINRKQFRTVLMGILVFMAGLTHYANATRAVEATKNMKDFWWQVSWRAPDFKPGTTLVASYPVGAIQEDYFVWGPANLIYYPEKQNVIPIEIQIPAAVLTPDVTMQILLQKGEESPLRRGNLLTRHFDTVLVLSQADPNSCVRILDGRIKELSTSDRERIMMVAPNSNMDGVITQGDTPVPPSAIFGEEPVHEWCYYYQKASLARQRGEWETVAKLGEEAQKLGLSPNDQIELMPFLQAHAILGDLKQVQELSTRINTKPFYRHQACQNLKELPLRAYPLSAEMQDLVDELFCK